MQTRADGMVSLVDAVLSSRKGREDRLNDLREETFATMNKFRADHKEMANGLKNQLGGFMADLRSTVGSFVKECQEQKRALHADNQAAHAAWFGPRTPKKRK